MEARGWSSPLRFLGVRRFRRGDASRLHRRSTAGQPVVVAGCHRAPTGSLDDRLEPGWVWHAASQSADPRRSVERLLRGRRHRRHAPGRPARSRSAPWLQPDPGARVSPEPIALIWPPGFTARFAPQLEVIDPIGQIVMREGDPLGGSCLSASDIWGTGLDCGPVAGRECAHRFALLLRDTGWPEHVFESVDFTDDDGSYEGARMISGVAPAGPLKLVSRPRASPGLPLHSSACPPPATDGAAVATTPATAAHSGETGSIRT